MHRPAENVPLVIRSAAKNLQMHISKASADSPICGVRWIHRSPETGPRRFAPQNDNGIVFWALISRRLVALTRLRMVCER